MAKKKRKYTKQQVAIIKQNYSKKKPFLEPEIVVLNEKGFPVKFPFWARLKISKNRTTLVIDEEMIKDKHHSGKLVEGYVHREAIHPNSRPNDYEKIDPNPDKDDKTPMYLKRPAKLPKTLFKPHNKKLDMPEHLRQRYDKNNHKNKQ